MMALTTATLNPGIYDHGLEKPRHETNTHLEDATGKTKARYWADLVRSNLAQANVRPTEVGDGEDRSNTIDEAIMKAPRRSSSRGDLARNIAAELYPDLHGSVAAIIQYEKDVVLLRSL